MGCTNMNTDESRIPMRAKPRRGRPPRTDKAATERIEIRVTRLERAAWEHEAVKRNMTLSEWVRGRCLLGERVIERTNERIAEILKGVKP